MQQQKMQQEQRVRTATTNAASLLQTQTVRMIRNFPNASLPQTKSAPVVVSGEYVERDTKYENEKRPMTWGQPTWYFFHTIAEKVDETRFHEIRDELLSMLMQICVNLPCNICSNHAVEYTTKTSKLSDVRTKQELKDYFYKFHNVVNERKGYQIFPRDLLDTKYASANFGAIIVNFISNFKKNTFSVRMISDDMFRQKTVHLVKTWLIQNQSYFKA